MPFPSLSAFSLHLPTFLACQLLQWVVDVAVRLFAVRCPSLVESSRCFRNDNRHKLLCLRNLRLKLRSLKTWELRLHLWPASTCIYVLSVPFLYIIVRISCLIFLCLVLIPWCCSKCSLGLNLSPSCLLLMSPWSLPYFFSLQFCFLPLHVIWVVRD